MVLRRRRLALVVLAFVIASALFSLHSAVVRAVKSPSSSSGSRSGPRWPWRRVAFRESSFDWNSVPQRFPVDAIRPLPKNHATPLRRIQHDFSSDAPHPENDARRNEVRNTFLKSWRNYKAHAWGLDEMRPMSGGGKNTFGGYAATLVDALDTLWIMDLRDEFYDAAAHAARIDWAKTQETALNLFETNIRHLGGLLSAYDLSGERALLRKARELGDMLYLATDTPNRMPGFWANFEDMRNGAQMAGTSDPSASPGSLALEFTRLSQLTGDPKYHDAVDRIKDFLAASQQKSLLPGMWPRLIDFRNQRVEDNTFTLGALADSLYEYLPKMHALHGGRDPAYEAMYRAAMDTVKEHILFRPMLPEEEDVLFAGDARVTAGRVEHIPDGQHLACFAGGMFALGGRLFAIEEHVSLGDRLARGCAWAYAQFPAGVMPELFTMIPCKTLDGCGWDENMWDRRLDPTLKKSFTVARDTRYILRPEAAESLFLLYRITGNQEFQDLAWRMFKAILAATDAPLGNSAIADVRVLPWQTTKTDSMESFWMAETLKYFYLIFSPPDLISLDEYVLNTEAHPLRLTT